MSQNKALFIKNIVIRMENKGRLANGFNRLKLLKKRERAKRLKYAIYICQMPKTVQAFHSWRKIINQSIVYKMLQSSPWQMLINHLSSSQLQGKHHLDSLYPFLRPKIDSFQAVLTQLADNFLNNQRKSLLRSQTPLVWRMIIIPRHYKSLFKAMNHSKIKSSYKNEFLSFQYYLSRLTGAQDLNENSYFKAIYIKMICYQPYLSLT